MFLVIFGCYGILNTYIEYMVSENEHFYSIK